MKFDRGFIKWQPFNSVIPSSTVLNNLTKKASKDKPTLFPEEQDLICEKIKEAFYAKEMVVISYYEAGDIKNIKTFIRKLNPNFNTLVLGNYKTIAFSQIVKII